MWAILQRCPHVKAVYMLRSDTSRVFHVYEQKLFMPRQPFENHVKNLPCCCPPGVHVSTEMAVMPTWLSPVCFSLFFLSNLKDVIFRPVIKVMLARFKYV